MIVWRKCYSVINIRHVKYRYAIPANGFCTNAERKDTIEVGKKSYTVDEWTNITPKIMSYLNRNIHLQYNHPLSIVRQRIVKYFYKSYKSPSSNPLFSVFDNISPIVTTEQNFNNLLIAEDHPSRKKSDCYYINGTYLLRGHTTAHQVELLKAGLDNFIVVGPVFRRDEIDASHYPVFHQLDAVRILSRVKLFSTDETDPESMRESNNEHLQIYEKSPKELSNAPLNPLKCIDVLKQSCHTLEAVKLMEFELKAILVGLMQHLMGDKIEYRWVDTTFPFTMPSWELEIFHNGKWFEILGAGIMQDKIIRNAGLYDCIGYAFGMGLERIAMILYDIPDIRLFWSNDSGFLQQFNEENLNAKVTYKLVSNYPQCPNDVSFWLPEGHTVNDFEQNDFYDLARNIGGDMIEQISLIDNFKHPKTGKTSLCFRIIYRHMERTLTQSEVNQVHKEIEQAIVKNFNVQIR